MYTNKYNISNKHFYSIHKRKQLIHNIKYTVKLYELRTNTQYIVSGDFPLGLVSFRVPSTVLSSHVVSMHPYKHHIFYKRYMNDLHFVLTYVIAQ